MAGFLTALKSLLGCEKKAALTEAGQEALKRAYRDRCQQFKLLLAANNRALEVMADMEEALRGARPFGMNYVRAQCTRVSS
ncbi:MAG: hypothetical protein PHV85_08675, partial [Desulfovibrionaceae bacterium]|nr:hypothetical protein [Desulfovibrionaceae bacterium]